MGKINFIIDICAINGTEEINQQRLIQQPNVGRKINKEESRYIFSQNNNSTFKTSLTKNQQYNVYRHIILKTADNLIDPTEG